MWFQKADSSTIVVYGIVIFFSVSLYLLCHVGLRQVVEDKSNLLLNILWRLYNPFRLISGHQQGVDVGCVYGGLQLGSGTVMFTDSSLRLEYKSERIDKAHIKGAWTPIKPNSQGHPS